MQNENWVNVQHLATKHLEKNNCQHMPWQNNNRPFIIIYLLLIIMFIYLSPELAACLKDVWFEDTWFKHHAVLQVISFHDHWSTSKNIYVVAVCSYRLGKGRSCWIGWVLLFFKYLPKWVVWRFSKELEHRGHQNLISKGLPGLRPNQRGRASTHDLSLPVFETIENEWKT